MATRTYTFKVTTTGANGSGVGTASLPVTAGIVLRVRGKWHASAPNTSVFSLDEADDLGTNTIAAISNSVAAFDFPPFREGKTTANAALDPVVFTPMAVSEGKVTLSVTGCNALTNALIVKMTVLE